MSPTARVTRANDHRGFALLATLWLLVALTALAGVGIGIARLGTLTTRNRVLLARAGWAREACVEILLARYAEDPAVRVVLRVDLGRRTWCEARLTDPGAAAHVNVADSAVLARLFSSEGATRFLRAVLARRAATPFATSRSCGDRVGIPRSSTGWCRSSRRAGPARSTSTRGRRRSSRRCRGSMKKSYGSSSTGGRAARFRAWTRSSASSPEWCGTICWLPIQIWLAARRSRRCSSSP